MGRHLVSIVAACVLLLSIGVGLLGGYWPSVVALITTYAIAAIGLQLMVGWTGIISVGHAGFMAIGAYTCAVVTASTGNHWLGMACAVVAAALGGLLVAAASFRAEGLFLAIITLAFTVLVHQAILALAPWTKGSGGLPVTRPSAFGIDFSSDRLFFILPAVACSIVLVAIGRIRHTAFGRALITVKASPAAASSLGISPPLYKLAACVLSAGITGGAGVLYGWTVGFLAPDDFSVNLSILVLAMVIVGGVASPVGAVVGAATLAIVPLVWAKLASLDALFYGVLLLVSTVLLGQAGIVGGLGRLFARVNRFGAGSGAPAVNSTGSSPAWPDELPTAEADQAGALVVEHISVAFGGVMALQDASVHARPGAITGVIGPNGAGKSTLFNCISGFVRPGGGTLHLAGVDLLQVSAETRARMGIARTFQNLVLVPELTVEENILLGCDHSTVGPSAGTATDMSDRQRTDWLVRLFGLEAYRHALPAHIPYGVAKKTDLARALASQPRMLLLDEPASGLNMEEALAIAGILAKIRRHFGTGMVMVEHNVPFIMTLADTLTVLHEGRTIATGTPEEIRGNAEVRKAYLQS